jgi:hypothetical protein
MAAPTPTARVAPAGIKLKDGFPTKITLAADTNIEFWEKQVKPPGIDGGDAVVQTTMQMFDPGELVEGTQPEATITIVPTNFDPSGKVEAAPVLTNVSGT